MSSLTCTDIYMHIYTYIYRCIHIHKFMCTYIHVYIHMCKHTFIYIYICFMCIQIYIYIYNMFICKSSITHSKHQNFQFVFEKSSWKKTCRDLWILLILRMHNSMAKDWLHSAVLEKNIRYELSGKWLFCFSLPDPLSTWDPR